MTEHIFFVEDPKGEVEMPFGRMRQIAARDPDRLYRGIGSSRNPEIGGRITHHCQLPPEKEAATREEWALNLSKDAAKESLVAEATLRITALVPSWTDYYQVVKAMEQWDAIEPVATPEMKLAQAIFDYCKRGRKAIRHAMSKNEVDAIDVTVAKPLASIDASDKGWPTPSGNEG